MSRAARLVPEQSNAIRLTPARASRKFRTDASEAIHSAASDLFAIGAIDKKAMLEFDASCFELPPLKAAEVKRIRKNAEVSQEVFARYLGTTKATVQKWESAQTVPSAMAQRLLRIIGKHGLDILP